MQHFRGKKVHVDIDYRVFILGVLNTGVLTCRPVIFFSPLGEWWQGPLAGEKIRCEGKIGGKCITC